MKCDVQNAYCGSVVFQDVSLMINAKGFTIFYFRFRAAFVDPCASSSAREISAHDVRG